MSAEIKTLATKEIYRNRWMALKEDRVQRADGSEGIYSVVEKGDFVVIIPLHNDEIFVVEQFRYPLGVRTIELPQGSWETSPTAAPEEVAAGELREETGLRAGKLEYVGYQKLAQGYSAQGYHIYLATELTHSGQQLDEEEYGLTVKKMKIADFRALILQGKISDATSVTAFLLASAKHQIEQSSHR
ncbi:NUDIX domain-containing protein [Kluyvera cryocrescens]|uniref:NUDIX domain-containing protein n=1 Tax=Kluyvera cryocrescens TaxID=580 RepID=UPI001A1D0931|nr:NUDIX hydrolase [Kluyvera cryocrescens]HDG1673540.1 NUDIX hydrolase [Kluyvera cryocrescens]